MGYQTGTNNGVTGLVNITGLTAFTAAVFGFDRAIEAQVQDFAGRGDTEWGDKRFVNVGGTLLIQGFAKPEKGYALPDSFKGATGSVVLQYNSTSGGTITKETVSVLVYSHKVGTQKKETDEWPITIACIITAHPTEANFHGTQITPTYPTFSDKVLYDGILKRYDPNNLIDGSSQTYLMWGVTDSDAAEKTKITTLIGTAVDPINRSLKIKNADLTRINWLAVRVAVTWSLTNTVEDWNNPQTSTIVDPNKMQTGGTVAAINSTPAIPTISGQTVVERNTKTVEIHDNATGHVTTYGQRDTIDDVEMEETFAKVDDDGLTSSGQDTNVYAQGAGEPGDASPPDSSLQVVGQSIQEINLDRKKKITYFDVNTSAEKVIFGEASDASDPSNLTNVTIKGAIHDTGSVPGAPGASGLVLHSLRTRVLSSGNTSDKSVTFWRYAEQTTADEVKFPHTFTVTDANLLASEAETCAIFTTGSPPGDPTLANHVIYTKRDALLTDASASNKSLRVYTWKLRDSKDAIEMDESEAVYDEETLIGREKVTEVYTTLSGEPASPPSFAVPNMKVRTRTIQEINRLKSKVTTDAGLTDPNEDVTRPGTSTTDDPNALASEAQQTMLHEDEGSSPDYGDETITLPTDVEPLEKAIQQINDNKWKTTLKWAINSSKNLWERLKKKVTTDVGHVGQEAVIVKILDTASPSADDTYNPDTTNLEFATAEVIPVSSTQFAHIYTFRPLSPKDKATEDFKQIVDDPVTLLIGDDRRRIIDANATTSAPAVTAVNGQTVVCVKRLTTKIGRTLYQHDYWYDFRSIGDDHEAKQTRTKIDTSALDSEAMTADVWLVSGGAPGTPTLSGFVLLSKDDREIENPLYRLRVYSWGLVTTAQKITYAESKATADFLDGYDYDITTIVSDTGTALNTLALSYADANKADATFVKAKVWRLTPDLVAKTLTFTGEDQKRHSFSVHTLLDSFRGKPAAGFEDPTGFGDPDSFVKVSANVVVTGGPGGGTTGDIEPTYWRRQFTYFKVRRRFITTTARKPEDFEFRAQQNTVNDAAFCGYLADQVMFEGSEVIYNGTLNNNHLVVIDLCFKRDSLMHMIDGNLPSFGTHTVYNIAGLITGSGYYDPDAYFSNSTGVYYMDWPAESSFSSFGVL